MKTMQILRKGGICLKRILSMALLCCLVIGLFVMPASADSYASKVDSYITVNSEGDAIVALTATLHLDSPNETLTFPLPLEASGITMNGGSCRTTKTASAIEVDVGRATGGLIGDFTVRFDFTIPEAVGVVKGENGERYLELTLPLLSGFQYSVQSLNFVITLPGEIKYVPNFTSIYRQNSIASDLKVSYDGSMLTGSSITTLNDHEAVTMTMVVPGEMFPTISTYIREGEPELIPMLIFAGLAMLYWLLTLRTWPLIRRRNVNTPEGISAGELGCHLTLAGGDLTMMSVNWAQLGYILIQVDGQRVYLHKRMDMGNERSPFENKVFQMLFHNREAVDATSLGYAKLSRKVFAMVPGERNLVKPNSGNMKVFRGLLCISQMFCGICVAMNMTTNGFLQVLLSIILVVFGAISAWQIHEVAYRTHLRGKTRVYIGLVCILIWILLGVACGQWIIPLCAALGQLLLSYFAAYGGRRNDLGRYDAGMILGLRSHLKRMSRDEIPRLLKNDPDFFFNMAPYALALGVLKPFAASFGSRKMDHCPYIISNVTGKRTAEEWGAMIADTADKIDELYRRMEIEKWFRWLQILKMIRK